MQSISLSRGVQKHALVRTTLMAALLSLGGSLHAAPVSSGQLVVVNGLSNASSSGTVGNSASSVSVVVSDSVGPCSTTATVAYNGTVVVKWAASNTHSATVCNGISSVAITPLKSTVGSVSTIIYDSTSATTIPANTATAVTFTAPTVAYANLVLIVTGTGVPASPVTATATAWGVGAASAPVFDTGNGSLTTVGVPGAIGAGGLKAERIMRRFAVIPMKSEEGIVE